MNKLTILAMAMGSFLLAACSGSNSSTSSSSRLHLDGVVDGCQNVQQICAESYPPQCFDYCADEDPGQGGGDCQPVAGAIETCGGEPCAVGVDENGAEFEVCYPPDCTVSYDAATGVETIECPTEPADPGPGAVPGSPGGSDPGGSEPGDPGGSEPGAPEGL